MKNLGFIILIFVFFVLGCGISRQAEVSNRDIVPVKLEDVQPLFDVNKLVNKSPAEVDAILGQPTDSWITSGDPTRTMQTYAYGEELLIMFHKNKTEIITFFYSTPQQSVPIGFKLCGIDLKERKADRLIESGSIKSFQFDRFRIQGTTAKIVFLEDSIKFDFRR